MKRLIIALILLAGICSVGFAQEDTNEYSSAEYQYRATSGGFWIWEENCNGGAGEFGINLLKQEKNFVFRNCIFVQGEGGSGNLTTDRFVDFGGIEIGDKLIFGGRANCPGFIVRTYGYAGASFGLLAWDDHKFFSKPFLLSAKFGGGFEFQYLKNLAFVIEFGGVERFLIGQPSGALSNFSKCTPSLTIGYRSFK